MRLIYTQGRGLEALVEIAGQRLVVLDVLSPVEKIRAPGDLEDATLEVIAIEALTEDGADVEGRPAGFERERGWRYRAVGEIVSTQPLVLDFGVLRLEVGLRAKPGWRPGDRVAVAIDRIRLVRQKREKAVQ